MPTSLVTVLYEFFKASVFFSTQTISCLEKISSLPAVALLTRMLGKKVYSCITEKETDEQTNENGQMFCHVICLILLYLINLVGL